MDEITFTITSLPEFSLDIDNREQKLVDGAMSISGVINAHNGLDLNLGGAMDIVIEPYNQALLDSAVIEWGSLDSNGDLPFTVTFAVDESIPRNEFTIHLNVIALDGGIAHTASVAFVTQSSTLDGTATAAGSSSVSNGDTSQHDGTDTSASNLVNGDSSTDDSSTGDSSTGDSSTGDTNNNGNSGINSESILHISHLAPAKTNYDCYAQPTIVSDYRGLPPGGQYDGSWQMMSDGSFTRL